MPSSSSIRDRTSELHAILQASLSSTSTTSKKPTSSSSSTTTTTTTITSRSEFSRLAATVGRDIQYASDKLGALTKLAQRRSLFDDPTAQIHALTGAIKRDINALNSKLGELQRLRGTATNRQAGDHSHNVVNSLKGRLGETAQGFQKVLKMRTDSLAAQHDRRAHFVNATAPAPAFDAPPGSVALDLGTGSVGGARGTGGGEGQVIMGGGGGELGVVRRGGDSSYQDARANAVRQVESTIVELGEIFNQLATMVSEQGELVERIDSNVDETVTNMSAGQNQLMIYYNSIAGNRTLILKVFAVLLAFLLLWTFIL